MPSEADAVSLLHKLGEFTRTLEPNERELFAALIGPGVERAIDTSEVDGFADGAHESDRLVRALTALARTDHAIDDGENS